MADAPPPALPGYDYVRELGAGGFADVHLYRQRLPSREVAVKVLRQPTSSAADRAHFENEANRMAMLSSHPSIVTIYEVGVSPDERPYLTMEFCPNDHFGRIARTRPLTVTRALEVGIKVAAALETAHAASILHRDVKPANILLTTYGEPALTDFGIAGGGIEGDVGDDELAVSQGVSIPFAAPEVLSGSTVGDEASDVYSLAATVYALLAGRAPFSTGEQLSEAQLVERVLNAALAPTGRADVPPTLERVLADGMARNPPNRYQSAAAFGRALQGVEAELGLAQTPLRIAGTVTVPPPQQDDDEDGTRLTSLKRVDPDGPAADRPAYDQPAGRANDRPADWAVDRPAPLPDGALGDRTVRRRAEGTGGTTDPAGSATEDVARPGSQAQRLAVFAVAGVVIVAAVAFVLSKGGGDVDDDGTATTTTTGDGDSLVVAGVPPRPDRVHIERLDGGGQELIWTIPSPAEGDTFQVFFTDGPGDLLGTSETTTATELRIDTDRRVCASVETIRNGRVSDASPEVCTP